MATARKRNAAARTAKGSSFCSATCDGRHKNITTHQSMASVYAPASDPVTGCLLPCCAGRTVCHIMLALIM